MTMFCCVPVSLYFQDGAHFSFIYSSLTAISLGVILWLYRFRSSAELNKREGYIIVVSAWLGVSIIGALPYLFDNTISALDDALFESISGFTTTGASIITDIEAVPSSILLWRSLTQWIGGMGIIVLTVAIFPLLGIAGIELFVAESPGPTSDRIHPRIKDTARTLWYIYFGLSIVLMLLLWIGGMTGFDAINHGLTTMATGGFSTKNNSIAHYDSAFIQYVIVVFMIFAGTNFTILYYALRGKFRKVYENEEWRMYMTIIAIVAILGTLLLQYNIGQGWEKSFRDVLFNGVSLITTTGFVTTDYTLWGPSLFMIFFILLFSGACAGSTSGGIKLIRHLVFMRNSLLEFKRLLHPRALIRLKINKELVAPRIMTHILVFLLVYLFLFSMGSFLLASLGLDFETSIGAAATSMGNVGPAIGTVGPVDNFAHFPAAAKMICGFLMICGRLELFTVVILFTPYFWRSN